MLKLLFNLVIVFFAVALGRRLIRGVFKVGRSEEPKQTPPRREPTSDLGQGQKIEEADYEDLP